MSPASVSVVIPVYNCEKYLGEALQSVLEQSPPPREVVVIDDGSTDGSAEVAGKFQPRVKVVQLPHSGIGSARNEGVRSAQGEFLAFLDSDDLWTPGKLASQLESFERNPSLDMVFGQMTQFVSPELVDQLAGKVRFDEAPARAFLPGALMIRRDSFLRVGFFEENLKVGEYIEWHMRALERGLEFEVVPRVLLRRRIHEQNQTRIAEFKADYARIVARSLLRRRKKSGL